MTQEKNLEKDVAENNVAEKDVAEKNISENNVMENNAPENNFLNNNESKNNYIKNNYIKNNSIKNNSTKNTFSEKKISSEKLSEIKLVANPRIKKYLIHINEEALKRYELAQKARAKGLDVKLEVETKPAMDLADRVEKIIELPGVARRFREINEKIPDRRKAYFELFKEIIDQKWCSIPDDQKRVETAIKTCLLIETEGVVVAPLDGVPKIEINKNSDGTKYIDIYFAGPIRAAGGSATVIPLILGDYARELMKLDKYKPTESEVERYVEEIGIYQTEIISRQYTMKDDEIRLIVKNCPVCVNGVPTEQVEVSVNRDIPRIPTNRIRGGMGLVVAEGIALKALWVIKTAKNLGLNWDWLEKIVKIEKTQTKIEVKPNPKYLDRLAAGRPLLAYPSRWGGLRLRYGRGRNTGLMAKAINPAMMYLLDEFIAVGTHIRVERPGKAGQTFPCTEIDGPIILLQDGTVEKVDTEEKAIQLREQTKKILYLGDMLVPIGDFRKTAHPLMPVGYNEEWWVKEAEKIIQEKKINNKEYEEEIQWKKRFDTTSKRAIELTKIGIPLHPKYLHYYDAITPEETKTLIQKLKKQNLLEIPFDKETKEMLEKIGLPHSINENKTIKIKEEYIETIQKTFLTEQEKKIPEKQYEKSHELLTEYSGIEIRDKAGTFIGGRMGRPEAAKERQMKGNPHALFPIGLNGGATRSMNKAIMTSTGNKTGEIEIEIAAYKDMKTGKITCLPYSRETKERTVRMRYCRKCDKITAAEKCTKCGEPTLESGKRKINLMEELDNAQKELGIALPTIIKGVKGMINDSKIPEPLEKGILRAKHNIHVFRDGTSRYELLNATMTHFYPREIGLSVEKAKQLGYEKDVEGKELTNENQLLELYPQDIIVHEGCGDWMLKMSRFIDELLEKYYKMEPFYKAQNRDDLIGELVLGLAPHTSASVVARVIGYTKSRLGWGHPYFVVAKRRNVDGDQDSVSLLLDTLLNFSENYLSIGRGGRMDASIVFSTIINPNEIDDEVYNIETGSEYNLDLYEKSKNLCEPYLENMPIVKDRLKTKTQYDEIGFTHNTKQFDQGPKFSQYVQLKSMEEKILRQADLQRKIIAVDRVDALERVMLSHFIPDIIGNTRAFSRQSFRCTNCNESYRRIPLSGACNKCKSGNIILTIAQGSVKKYLEIAKSMAAREGLSDYLRQRLDLIGEEIDSVFNNDKVQQKNLFEFM